MLQCKGNCNWFQEYARRPDRLQQNTHPTESCPPLQALRRGADDKVLDLKTLTAGRLRLLPRVGLHDQHHEHQRRHHGLWRD